MKRALITGITGQDGSYLAELLLQKGYEVHGLIRRSSGFNTGRVDHLYVDPHEPGPPLFLHYGDMTDASSLDRLVAKIQPNEIYNLAAQSHVRISFDTPAYTGEVVALGAMRLLESVRHCCPEARVYQASSSELFGSAPPPQNEQTPFHPRSPYAAAKAYAYYAAQNYREAYGLYVCNGILFNHESERRKETFVTRKITRAVGRIKAGLQNKLYLGNLDAMRDWGYAPDYVQAMWLMLQQNQPRDLVIGTGKSRNVRMFLGLAFERAGLDPDEHVELDKRYLRPSEVDHLRADASMAANCLGWKPKTTFFDLVNRMTEHDIRMAEQEKASNGR